MIFNTALYYLLVYFRLKDDTFGAYLLQAGYLKVQLFTIFQRLGVIILSSFVIALFFAMLVYLTKGRGMGGGDVRMGFFIGIFNGFPYNIIAIFMGFVLGAFVSLILVVTKRKTLKDTVPFGPFLILGSLIALVWGQQIWHFYNGLFY
jgi:prepilin signal peptidase PulO-like enzyme (type II secretory pathway)